MTTKGLSKQNAVRFRFAVRNDVPAIVALLAGDDLGIGREKTNRRDEGVYLKAFEEMEAQGGNQYLLAVDEEDKILGCAQIVLIPGLSRSGMKRAQVDGVRVAQSARGAGLGKLMMAEVHAIALSYGCGLVQLTTDRSRAEAHRFYEQLGYENTHHGLKLAL